MQVSRIFARPPAVFALALFGLLPLAWKASEAAPEHGLVPGALRAHFALRPHGTLRQHGSAASQPPTAVPLYTFTGMPDGLGPQSRLLQGSDGNFYGTTADGGSFGFGAIYRLTPAGKVTVLASFPKTQGGSKHPSGPLVEGLNTDGTPNGAFYGLTDQGGTSDTGVGTIYLFAADGGSPTGFSITQLYSFTGGADGGRPLGALTVGRKADGTPDGYLYGTTTQGGTSAGGAAGGGVVFRVPKDGFAEDVLHTFAAVDTSTGTAPVNDGGAAPHAGLLQRKGAAGWGSFFGTTSSGGAGGAGTVFSLTPAGKLVTIHDFLTTADGLDGRSPQSGLVQGANGTLYGTTFTGGGTGSGTGNGIGSGTVYRLVADSSSTGFTYSQVAALSADTSNPNGELIEATDGKLYGTSTFGGATYDGSVFRIDADAASATGYSATVVQDFPDSKAQGGYLLAGVIQGTDGDLYGATTTGGSASDGTLFRLNVVPPKKAPAPTITSAEYHVNGDGTSFVLVNGTGFQPGLGFGVTPPQQNTTVTVVSATQVRADLTGLLPAGDHTVTVTNPDGQSAAGTLTTLDAPLVESATAVTDTDGSVHLVVTGLNFGTPGYDQTPDGSDFVVFDGSGNTVDHTVSIRPSPPKPAGGDQQAILTLNGTGDGSGYRVIIVNADGQHSPFTGPSPKAKAKGAPHALVSDFSAFNVYTSDPTQYDIDLQDYLKNLYYVDGFDTNDAIAIFVAAIPAGYYDASPSPTQLLLGQVSFISTAPSTSVLASGIGTNLTGLISQDGAGIVSHDSGGIVSHDSGGIVSHDSGGIVSHDSGGVISNDGGSIVSHDSGGVISNDGGSILPVSSLLGPIASAAGITGNLGLTPSSLVATGGGNIAAHVAPGLASRVQQAGAPLSFTLTRHDEGPKNGTGSTDGTVTLKDAQGHSALALDIRYTAGKPDIITYRAPGVKITPRVGTPAPLVSNPIPTLTALSPGKAPAGSPDLTLGVTGTLFEDGTVVNWNGKPLATRVLSGTQATAVVPASLLSAAGTAQVTVTNPAPGGGASAPLPFVVIPATPLHTFPAGLQMLSVTEDYANVGLSAALSDSSHTLMVWNPATSVYDPHTDLHPGVGYWVRLSKATDLHDTGALVPTNAPFSIPLQAGWNMIGDPFASSVALSSLTVQDAAGTQGTFRQAVSGGVVSGTLYAYPAGSTQYQKVGQDGSLTPFDGEWVYAFHACTLLVPGH